MKPEERRTAIAAWLAGYASRVEADLSRRLTPQSGPEQLVAAMRHSLMAGGKRLRPALVLATCDLLDRLEPDQALPAASALEMIHTYSLIHDDLPAMDDDDLRRGRPTCHKVYGEALAILAGDALLTLAFETLGELGRRPAVGPDRTARAVVELAQAAGAAGMVGGQADDLAWEGKAAPAEVLRSIHRRKTGCLFAAAVRIGGIVAGADAAELAALTRYAEQFGLAFQIQDDILDMVGDAAQTGKATGRDVRKSKSTYVRLFGLDGARDLAAEAVAAARSALAPFGHRAERLADLARYVVDRER